MCHSNKRRTRTTKSKKNQNARRKKNYKYMRILAANTIKQLGWKKKNLKEYLRWTRKLLNPKFCSRYLIKGINTWVVPLVRYSGPFLKWTREELPKMDYRTRKLMTMDNALHSKYNICKLYVSRKEGRRRLTSFENTMTRRQHKKD